jgi:DNA polymerase (family 10)
MNLARAALIATKICTGIQPMCERVEIAGSIRRARPEVNDIDLVILAHQTQLAAIHARFRKSCTPVTTGLLNCIYRLRLPDQVEVQIDLFFARPPLKELLQTVPGNFGSLLLCRTGSKEHNIHLVEHAKRRGLQWKPYEGVFDGDGYCLASETEESIFDALNLPFIPPERRER